MIPDGYITLQEAADLLGVSRQTVTRRAAGLSISNLGRSTDGPRTGQDSNADTLSASIVQGKNRYILRAWVLAEQEAAGAADGPRPTDGRSTDGPRATDGQTADTLHQRIQALEKDLLAARGEIATLQATVTAQEAHIDSLKRALDAEQALHMASLQQRLPAGRGLIGWIKGWGKK